MIEKKHISSLDDIINETKQYEKSIGVIVKKYENSITIADENNKIKITAFIPKGSVDSFRLSSIRYHTSLGNVTNFYTCSNTNSNLLFDRIIKTSNAFAFMSSTNNIPMFFVGKTSRNEVGCVGLSEISNTFTKCQMCTEDIVELPKNYEITKWGVDNSNTTSLINMPIPESTYSEYFNDLYFIFSRQNTSVGKIEINGKKFYSNGYIAMYDEEG